MRRTLSLALLLLAASAVLIGCTTTQTPFTNVDLTREDWMSAIETDPTRWTLAADTWFLTGQPNATEQITEQLPSSATMTTAVVTNFTEVKIEGDFQVQIYGSDQNSVSVMGPSADVRKVIVDMAGNVLCIRQVKDQPCDMRQVIVRIGINQLNRISHIGCGPVEGIHLNAYGLEVLQAGTGNTYLSGNIGLRRVVNEGGNLTIIGTSSPRLDIVTDGPGRTNLSGNLNIKNITHHGMNDINIIGANSDGLAINTDGSGKVGISGTVNLREVTAKNNTSVFINSVTSDFTYAYAYDNAVIGMVGNTSNLYSNTRHFARFLGRFLCADSAFVRAADASHINVSACKRVFASATENASIYFFGAPEVISQFVSGNGSAIPVWGPSACVASAPVDYKGEMGAAPEGPRPLVKPVYADPVAEPVPARPMPRNSGLESKSSFGG
jgi:hypothetical protein